MAFIPHTDADREAMMRAVGVAGVEDLFLDVPAAKRFPKLNLPEPLSESEVLAELAEMADRNSSLDRHPCFLGAGAYNHFVPSVVKHMLLRGEFYTAYTPYQPEVSQGTLQAIFEYQSMVCDLTGMGAANASHYDGATALAEALVMAISVHRGRRTKAVISRMVHPEYRETARTYTQGMDLEVVCDCDPGVEVPDLIRHIDGDTAAVAIQIPDFLGSVPSRKDVAALAEACRANGALLVVVANPISLGLLQPPGEYGADIAVGEGQPLGNQLSFGGPYLGYFATKPELVRRMAGRLAGMTVDADGKRGYVLTLSTREQHIRREKATSNICTNQALNALAAAIYLAAMGPSGLRTVASSCYHKAHYCAAEIAQLPGYDIVRPDFFHEFVVRCPRPTAEVSEALLTEGIVPGYELGRSYPELEDCMLFCVTEMNTKAQMDELTEVLGALS